MPKHTHGRFQINLIVVSGGRGQDLKNHIYIYIYGMPWDLNYLTYLVRGREVNKSNNFKNLNLKSERGGGRRGPPPGI